MQEPERPAEAPRPRQVRKLSQWESAIEQQIREAQERGAFDRLPGQGKPLPREDWDGEDQDRDEREAREDREHHDREGTAAEE